MKDLDHKHITVDDFREAVELIKNYGTQDPYVRVHPVVYVAESIIEFLRVTGRRNPLCWLACWFISGKQVYDFARSWVEGGS